MLFAKPLPDCEDDQYVMEHYNSTSPYQRKDECLLEYRKDYAARIYFGIALLNALFIIISTFLFIYCASGPSIYTTSKPLDITQLKKARKRHSLQKRSVIATTLGAVGHLIFSTCMFLTHAFDDSVACQLFLYGVIVGFYTWLFALCIRAYRLRFLFNLNQLKVRYLRMSTSERYTCTNEKDYRWYLINQRNKNYVLIMPYVIYCVTLCIILVVAIPAEIRSMRTYGHCMLKWGAAALTFLYAIFIGIVAPFMLWYLRKNSDAHGIRTEIWIDAIIGIPFFILFVIWFKVAQTSPLSTFYVKTAYGPSCWAVFFTIVAHTISVVVPLIDYVPIENKYWIRARSKVKQFYRKVTKQPPNDLRTSIQLQIEQLHNLDTHASVAGRVILPELSMESLERTLADPVMMNALQDLAIRDFSSENLLFYENYLQLQDKLKKELVPSRHNGHSGFHNVGMSRNWAHSWSKKPSLTHIVTKAAEATNIDQHGDTSDNGAYEEEKPHLNVEQFLSIPIPFQMYQDFIHLYETFIREGSATQVNISYRARFVIDQAFHDIYKTNPELNPNTEGASSVHPMDCIYCSDEDEEVKREQEVYGKINASKRLNDDVIEHQESKTILDFNMFEAARIEVCWNIFNSVYPKLVDMYGNNNSSSNNNEGTDNFNNHPPVTP